MRVEGYFLLGMDFFEAQQLTIGQQIATYLVQSIPAVGFRGNVRI